MLIVFLIKTEVHFWLSAQGLYAKDPAGPILARSRMISKDLEVGSQGEVKVWKMGY